ncbi:hypothetical protein [Streptomonospora litoralis]|uniref:Uncharacterized protein n=1 Tax=Streptomonospora litoralis TaxID=2498135 RepID=A0A4P6PYG4_9ACTN|nr:hypothetical protein [Streptomonospora litoralis]QBI51911.1 hypothetical protein EKD16_00445 [Streptomonospora litoralis]
MSQVWPMKALGAMTAAEVLAALKQLPYLCPEDAALEKALRAQLSRVVEREHRPGAQADWAL